MSIRDRVPPFRDAADHGDHNEHREERHTRLPTTYPTISQFFPHSFLAELLAPVGRAIGAVGHRHADSRVTRVQNVGPMAAGLHPTGYRFGGGGLAHADILRDTATMRQIAIARHPAGVVSCSAHELTVGRQRRPTAACAGGVGLRDDGRLGLREPRTGRSGGRWPKALADHHGLTAERHQPSRSQHEHCQNRPTSGEHGLRVRHLCFSLCERIVSE